MTETNRIEYNRELTPELDIEKYSFLELQRGWKGISIEHVEKLASDKEIESYSKSLKIGDYCKNRNTI